MPDELRELYLTFGGQEFIGSGTYGLFGSHRLHRPTELIEHHHLFIESLVSTRWANRADGNEDEFDKKFRRFPPSPDEEVVFNPCLLPFASWDAYALCIDWLTGTVWECERDCVQGNTRRENIVSVVRELLNQLAAGRTPCLFSDPTQ